MIKKIRQYLQIRSELRREILELKKAIDIFGECNILKLSMENRLSFLKNIGDDDTYGWQDEQLKCLNKEIEMLINIITLNNLK